VPVAFDVAEFVKSACFRSVYARSIEVPPVGNVLKMRRNVPHITQLWLGNTCPSASHPFTIPRKSSS
jgi:hypothetical protein